MLVFLLSTASLEFLRVGDDVGGGMGGISPWSFCLHVFGCGAFWLADLAGSLRVFDSAGWSSRGRCFVFSAAGLVSVPLSEGGRGIGYLSGVGCWDLCGLSD